MCHIRPRGEAHTTSTGVNITTAIRVSYYQIMMIQNTPKCCLPPRKDVIIHSAREILKQRHHVIAPYCCCCTELPGSVCLTAGSVRFPWGRARQKSVPWMYSSRWIIETDRPRHSSSVGKLKLQTAWYSYVDVNAPKTAMIRVLLRILRCRGRRSQTVVQTVVSTGLSTSQAKWASQSAFQFCTIQVMHFCGIEIMHVCSARSC